MTDDTAPDEQKSLTLFGRDVTKIPCFRDSWLYGISSGIGAGLLTFMFTSRTNLASHMIIGTMCTVTLTYFCVCRYQFSQDQNTVAQIRSLMQSTPVTEDRREKYNETTT